MGAPDPVMLKTPPWTDRFFAAGGEDEVVSAMVAYTLKEQGRMERRFAKDSPGKSNPWMRDPTARAWLLEARNNRPVFAYAAAKRTLARTSGQEMAREAFLAVLESEIRRVYEAHDEGKAANIISKIPRTVPRAAVPPRPRLREPVRPPSGHTVARDGREGHRAGGRGHGRPAPRRLPGRGSGALAAIGAAGLVVAALRLLVAAGTATSTH